MVIELGHYFFLLSLFLSLLYPIILAGSFLKETSMRMIYTLPLWNFLFISISILCLSLSFIFSDFSVINVLEHSHSDLPLLFKISALWGNHEGSILLWTWIISLYTMLYTVFCINRQAQPKTSNFSMQLSLQGIILLFFLMFTELSSNPFLTVCIAFENGAELNPVLQDPVLAIHPPLIYLGYIGSIIPFSILLSSLVTRESNTWFFQIAKTWAIITWSLLSFGILLGSWWAYYELGWGGWWFWDPVENSSLIPWILGTALVHSFLYSSAYAKLWTITLSMLTFLSSILGTFFVRSGFLESVHSFANDSSRGIFLLVFFLLLLCLCLYVIYSRRYDLFLRTRVHVSDLGNLQLVLLSFIALIVLLGTFYPFLYKAFFHEAISIGTVFFHGLLGPIMGTFILFMCLVYLPWNKASIQKWFSEKSVFFIAFLSSGWIFASVGSFLVGEDQASLFYLSSLCIVGIALTMFHSLIRRKIHLGMVLSHLGFFLFFLGAILSSSLQHEIAQILHIGDILHFRGIDYVLQSTNQLDGPNYNSFYASLVGVQDGVPNVSLFPEKRYYYVQGFYATKPYVVSSLSRDIYVLLGDGNPVDGWEIKIYENPVMSWIWLGGLFVILGGIFSLKSPFKRSR